MKIPLVNTASELFIPVRLNYTIANPKRFTKIINRLGCVDILSSTSSYSAVVLANWLYSDEMLKSNYKGTQPPEKKTGAATIIGKIEFSVDFCTIIVNSVERAIAALDFFDNSCGKAILRFGSLDIYNKLNENDEELQEFYYPIERFFDNRVIKRHISAEEQQQLESLLEQRASMEMIHLCEKFDSRQLNEFENMTSLVYENGFDQLRFKLRMRMGLLNERLQSDSEISMYEFQKKLIQNQ